MRYTQKDGLINGRARFVYQDSKGRLYVSTFGGLSVYDGSRFVNYSTENGLSTSLVNDILELGEDSLLVVPNAHAMHLMVRGVIRDFPTTDHFYPVTNQIIRCENGEMYAIADDGLFQLERHRFVKLSLIDSGRKEAGPYLISAVESGRKLFILTDQFLLSYPRVADLLVYDLDTHRLLTAPGRDRFVTIAKGPGGRVFLGTEQGIKLVDGDALNHGQLRLNAPPPPYAAAAAMRATFLLFDRDGSLWLTTQKEVIRIDTTGELARIGQRGGLPLNEINSLFEDRERNIWLTNAQNGISRLLNREVRLYEPDPSDIDISDVAANLSSDSVWFYDWVKKELELQTPKSSRRYHAEGMVPDLGYIIAGKHLWLSSQHAISQLCLIPGTNRFRAVPVAGDPAWASGRTCVDRLGRLVMASNRLVLAGGGRVWQRTCAALCDQAAVDGRNRIWAVTRSDSLLELESDTMQGRTDLRLIAGWSDIPARSPRSVCVDSNGRVWIGTRDHGLFCLEMDGLKIRSYRQLTIDSGLSENFVRHLYCGPDNTIWAATPSGLDRICWKNGCLSITNITAGQGLGVLRIRQSADLTLWAMAEGGLLRIGPPVPVAKRMQPPVLFSQVRIGNQLVTDEAVPLTLSHDRNALSFNVGAPSFIDENQTRFSYMLEGGSESGWSAPSRQSAINFVNLPPGNYTLRVKAKFLSGIYPDAIGSYTFLIRPPWWQTVLFRVVAIVVLVFLVGWAIRGYTSNRLKAQRVALERQQAIEKERTRIATDMHDDLGAGLSRIKFLSDTIGIKQQQRKSIDEEIDGIREYSREMIDKMGEIVWALNQKHDLLSDLLSYTRSYAAAYLMQAAIHTRIEAPEEFPYIVVSGEFRRNVYLAVKEALHNIVKHSQAQEVTIRMEVDNGLSILLKDDGVGFDRTRIRPYANGLLNMERRISELGGKLSIDSGDSGTVVTIRVPV